jgi:hypothetical protein
MRRNVGISDSAPIIEYCLKAIQAYFDAQYCTAKDGSDKAYNLLQLRKSNIIVNDTETLFINEGLQLLVQKHENALKELEELHHWATEWLKEKGN